ncbi:MAG: hypothetical protein HY908_30025 [Myxococcales bacterium]|nr:hypothetical protein [Myxococcales bacterium]
MNRKPGRQEGGKERGSRGCLCAVRDELCAHRGSEPGPQHRLRVRARRSAVFVSTLVLAATSLVTSGCKQKAVACLSETKTDDLKHPKYCTLYPEKKALPMGGISCFTGDSQRDACPDGAKKICLERPALHKGPWNGEGWTYKTYYYEDGRSCDAEDIEAKE